jgi:hypothetical protein
VVRLFDKTLEYTLGHRVVISNTAVVNRGNGVRGGLQDRCCRL